jgi:hypothetical protein
MQRNETMPAARLRMPNARRCGFADAFYHSNDAYTPGSFVNTIQVGGRSVAGPCHKEKHC